MREYAARRGWTIASQVREVNSGTAKLKARERLLKVVCDPQVTDLIHAVSGTEVPSATKNRSVSAESKQAITGASACNR